MLVGLEDLGLVRACRGFLRFCKGTSCVRGSSELPYSSALRSDESPTDENIQDLHLARPQLLYLLLGSGVST